MAETRLYTPPPSVRGFLTCEEFISLICGPVGSTKTTAGIMKIAYHAARMAKSTDGIRRSRAIWVRNTREQLSDTSIPDFLAWFPDGQAGSYLRTERRFLLRFNDVECEVLFRGLDDTNDIRRLLSLQASFAILDEFREIHPSIFETLQSRLGRYPNKMMVPHRPEWGLDDRGNPVAGCVTDEGKQNRHIWGMTNPPDMDTYWEQTMSNPPANMRVFIQPSGMSDEADWLQHLPANYYEEFSQGKSQDFIDVYVHAKFGKSLAGRPVHEGFQRDFHVAKGPLQHVRSDNHPLIIGFDFGLNPSCTISQVDAKGRLLTYAALTSDGMGVLRFSQTRLKPLLTQRFAGAKTLVVGDPAGTQRAQTDERSVFDILRQEGFKVIAAPTNATAARVAALDGWLARQIDGGPAHLIDPEGCPVLVQALRSGYRYRRKKDGEYEPTPEKNLSSHVAEAHQYAALHTGGMQVFAPLVTPKKKLVLASAGGWT